MLRYLYGHQLTLFPKLRDSMFRDRADQFKTRLGWDVYVNGAGEERDQYDLLNPLYVIWERPDGRHGGSMRFLPSTGATMINDYFSHLTDGRRIESETIWECTRFCLAPGSAPQVSAALMLGGAEVGAEFDLSHAAGVFDRRMVRIYRRLGWGPVILGADGQGRDAVSVGLWSFSPDLRPLLAVRAGISAELSALWMTRALGTPEAAMALSA